MKCAELLTYYFVNCTDICFFRIRVVYAHLHEPLVCYYCYYVQQFSELLLLLADSVSRVLRFLCVCECAELVNFSCLNEIARACTQTHTYSIHSVKLRLREPICSHIQTHMKSRLTVKMYSVQYILPCTMLPYFPLSFCMLINTSSFFLSASKRAHMRSKQKIIQQLMCSKQSVIAGVWFQYNLA